MHGTIRRQQDRQRWPATVNMPRRNAKGIKEERMLAEECPVALVFDGTALAVVMATPSDLADLALGFSLTEGIVERPGDIDGLDIVSGDHGIELRTWLKPECGRSFKARQRRLVGPTGCGLCGIESLAEADRPAKPVRREITLHPDDVRAAVDGLVGSQHLNRQTRATHAAGLFVPNRGTIMAREDVGRHNALDKLAGAIASSGLVGSKGAIVLTSRVSVEMVQKSAVIGMAHLIAISAPTALAVRAATVAGITLIGIARGQEFEVFSHPAGMAL
jgi:FdhD protein